MGPAGKTALALGLALAAAACGSAPKDQPQRAAEIPAYEAPQTPQYDVPQGWQERPEFLVPQHLAGSIPTRVALLLPLGAEDEGVRHVAKSLRDAAELALFEIGSPDLLLIIKDTQGTADGATRAARRALDQGAEMILGPLFADSVRAVAPMARERGVAVVAFSSDRKAAGDGVYLLSFQVEEEIRRVVEFAARNEVTAFAALVPGNAYGERVRNALDSNVAATGGQIQHVVEYNPYTDDFRDPVRSIAEYGQRKHALDSQIAELRALQDEAAVKALERLKDSQTWGPVSYQAVLLPEGGTKLRSLAPMLPYFDIDNRTVRFLGTGLWDDPSLWKEPSLQGGWFAAPPPEMRATFDERFDAAFDYRPHRLASIAYDGVTLAAALGSSEEPGERFTEARLENAAGFAGIDGIFRFMPDGGTERGLAVLEVKNGRVEVVGEAPTSFDRPAAYPDPYGTGTQDPYGSAPYGSDPYGGQSPYGSDPYGSQPSDPYADPYSRPSADPYDVQSREPNGASPYRPLPTGVTSESTEPPSGDERTDGYGSPDYWDSPNE